MFSWFDLTWPWFGLAFAAVLVILLFATNLLRGEHPRMAPARPPARRDRAGYAALAAVDYAASRNRVR